MGLKQKFEDVFFKKDSQEFEARFKENMGYILNPPYKEASPEIQKSVDYIRGICMNLAGFWINAQKNNLVISILSSKKTINAYALANSTLSVPQEIQYGDRPYTLRKYWNAHSNTAPVYEVGVTLALLNSDFTEDELAFILAHELSHLMEGHTHHENDYEYRSTFMSSQTEEFTADTKAIDLMNGKYNPEAAFTAMEKVFEAEKKARDLEKEDKGPLNDDYSYEADIMDALMSGFSTHHHPAVRLSGIQTYIKYLKISGQWIETEKSAEKPSFDIEPPKYIEPQKAFPKDYSERFFGLFEKLFLEHEILFPGEFGHYAGTDDFRGMMSSLRAMSQEEFLNKCAEKFRASDKSPTEKLQSTILFLVWMSNNLADFDYVFKGVKKDNELSKWLCEISNEIDVEKFDSSAEYFKLMYEFNEDLLEDLMSEDCEFVLEMAVEAHPETWEKICKSLINAVYQTYLEKPNPERLQRYYDLYNYDWEKTPVMEFFNKQVVAFDKEQVTKEELKKVMAFFPGHDSSGLVASVRKESDENGENEAFPIPSSDLLLDLYLENLYQPNLSEIEESCTRDVLKYLIEFQYVLDGVERDRPEIDQLKILDVLRTISEIFHVTHVKTRDSEYTDTSDSTLLDMFLNNLSSKGVQKLTNVELNILKMFFCLFQEDMNLFIRLEEDSDWSHFLKIADHDTVAGLCLETPHCLDNLAASDGPSVLRIKNRYLVNGYQLYSAWTQFHFESEPLPDHLVVNIIKIGRNLRALHERAAALEDSYWFNDIAMSRYSQKTFAKVLDQTNEQIGLADWFDTYQLFSYFGFSKSHFSSEQYMRCSEFVFKSLTEEFSIDEAVARLNNEQLRKLLTSHELSELLMSFLKKVTPEGDRIKLRNLFRKLNNDFYLDTQYHEAFSEFRNEMVTHFQIQPFELAILFPVDNRSRTERLVGFSLEFRYLSAVCAVCRNQEPEDQLALINYLMGRSEEQPEFVMNLHGEILEHSNRKYGLIGPLFNFRSELSLRSEVERAFIINCMITGNEGLARSEKGQPLLIDFILQSFPEDKRGPVKDFALALIEADGHDCSMVLSYVLAQKNSNDSLHESNVIRAILESFGVPGQKIAQYLAFTNSFEEYYECFKDFQDEVTPESQFNIISLIQDDFGMRWPLEKKVLKSLGSGTVNLAVLVKDENQDKHEVLNILRKGIKAKTRDDFARFKRFISALQKQTDSTGYFSFIRGLSNVVQSSVELEFDKDNASKMQQRALELYMEHVGSADVQGVGVKTVPILQKWDRAMLMELAPGATAKNVLEKDPELYKKAMREVLEAEWFLLTKALKAKGDTMTIANPDLHDGQVIIEDGSISVIDFGQAIDLDAESSEKGLAVVKVVSGMFSADKALGVLQETFSIGPDQLQASELENILSFGSPMERFIHLVSCFGLKNIELPLATVHWVLAVNRLQELSHKVDVSFEDKAKALVLEEAGVFGRMFAKLLNVS